MAFACVGLKADDYVRVDKQFYRPAEVNILRGDAARAREALGWRPEVDLPELVEMMVRNDLDQL